MVGQLPFLSPDPDIVTMSPIAAASPGVCDIYASGGTPCVAAHSTTRSLYSNYTGPLYEVIRGSDNHTVDIHPLSTGGVADASSQDTFCSSTTCLIKTIYDQSGRGNHLTAAPPGGAAKGPMPGGYDFVASAVGAPVMVNGQRVYGVFSTPATGYRNDDTNGVATGNDPEGMYAVVDGTHYSGECCFDYGNAETDNLDPGKTYMEALYFGSGGRANDGKGGPWFEADLENGVFGGNQTEINPNNPSITHRFATGILKGDSSNLWALRGGNSQSGHLDTFYSGPRPEGYYPMHKEGAIILGIGGDNSDWSRGTFYEGAMTSGYPDDETEDKVQANIVKAGYQVSPFDGPELDVGSTISLKGIDSMFLGHNGSDVDSTSTTQDKDTEFKVVKGRANGDCYSFEAADSPDHFLRHYAYKLSCDSPKDHNSATFDLDSTFCTESSFGDDTSGIALRSFSYPTRYWRRNDKGEVFMSMNGGPFAWDDAEGFNDDTRWTVS